MPEKHQLTDQEFVENIVKAIVDHPEDVLTGRTLDERGVLIQLTVHREDMGKVIGREGRTAKAIRSLLRVFGARQELRINLKIVNPEGDTGMDAQEPVAAPIVASERLPKHTQLGMEADKAVAKTTKAEVAKKVEAPVPVVEEKATGVF